MRRIVVEPKLGNSGPLEVIQRNPHDLVGLRGGDGVWGLMDGIDQMRQDYEWRINTV